MKKHTLKLIFCTAILIFCCDGVEEDRIPVTYVSFSIDILTDPQFYDLRIHDNALHITNEKIGYTDLGYDNNGVIVYNTGGDEYYAFDGTCPHDIPQSVMLDLVDNNIAQCPVCSSRYILPSEGLPSNGSVSRYPLKKYRTTYNPNNGVLSVFN